MFQKLIISDELSIDKFFNQLYLTKPQLKHLKSIMNAMTCVSLLACDGLVLPYSIDIYYKDTMSKIEITQNLISSLPKTENKGFVLCDSWYSCKAIFNSLTVKLFNQKCTIIA